MTLPHTQVAVGGGHARPACVPTTLTPWTPAAPTPLPPSPPSPSSPTRRRKTSSSADSVTSFIGPTSSTKSRSCSSETNFASRKHSRRLFRPPPPPSSAARAARPPSHPWPRTTWGEEVGRAARRAWAWRWRTSSCRRRWCSCRTSWTPPTRRRIPWWPRCSSCRRSCCNPSVGLGATPLPSEAQDTKRGGEREGGGG